MNLLKALKEADKQQHQKERENIFYAVTLGNDVMEVYGIRNKGEGLSFCNPTDPKLRRFKNKYQHISGKRCFDTYEEACQFRDSELGIKGE